MVSSISTGCSHCSSRIHFIAGLDKISREMTPVLFLRGDQDATSNEVIMEQTERLCKATVITYKGVAHWPMIERKEQVAKDVLDWLGGIRKV
jgi:pimeloyl-ACP methyl ester carboxylesterase